MDGITDMSPERGNKELDTSQRFRANIGFAAPDLITAERRVRDMTRSWAAQRVFELDDQTWKDFWTAIERMLR
jgi:hypothetical protein